MKHFPLELKMIIYNLFDPKNIFYTIIPLSFGKYHFNFDSKGYWNKSKNYLKIRMSDIDKICSRNQKVLYSTDMYYH